MKTRAHFARTALVVLLFSFLTAHSLEAQYRGSFQGTITDATGAVVPGAKVTLTSAETNISHEVTTSEGGTYSFPALAPGRYNFKVEKTGFNAQVLNDVVLRSEQAQGQDIQLAVGQQTTQTVTVQRQRWPGARYRERERGCYLFESDRAGAAYVRARHLSGSGSCPRRFRR